MEKQLTNERMKEIEKGFTQLATNNCLKPHSKKFIEAQFYFFIGVMNAFQETPALWTTCIMRGSVITEERKKHEKL